MHFSELSYDIQLHILSYFTIQELDRYVAPVCRAWYHLCQEPHLRTKLRVGRGPATADAVAVIRRSPYLKTLFLEGRTSCDVILTTLAKYCPLLTTLSVRTCQLNDETLRKVAEKCPNLTHLEIGTWVICSKGFEPLLDFHNLRSLSVIDQFTCTFSSIVPNIGDSFPYLQELNLDGTTMLKEMQLADAIRSKRNMLKRLIVDGIRFRGAAYQAIAECHNMEALGLNHAWFLTDQMFERVVTCNRKAENYRAHTMKWLRLHGLYRVPASSLLNINQLNLLQHLDFEEMTLLDDNVLIAIANECHLLTHFGVSRCRQVSDTGVAAIVEKCSRLRLLDVSWLCRLVGTSLLSIPVCLPDLEWLNVYLSRYVDGDAIRKEVVAKCPKLTVIGIAGLRSISEDLRDLSKIYNIRCGTSRPCDLQLKCLFKHPGVSKPSA